MQSSEAMPHAAPADHEHDLTEEALYALPVHGPDGRVATVRRAMKMRQKDFAEAIDVARETVSHWENLFPPDDPEGRGGEPRQQTTRAKSAAIAELCRERLGLHMRPDAFYGLVVDNVLTELRREQERQGAQLTEALELLGQLMRRTT